jgi:hypothetical protein
MDFCGSLGDAIAKPGREIGFSWVVVAAKMRIACAALREAQGISAALHLRIVQILCRNRCYTMRRHHGKAALRRIEALRMIPGEDERAAGLSCSTDFRHLVVRVSTQVTALAAIEFAISGRLPSHEVPNSLLGGD